MQRLVLSVVDNGEVASTRAALDVVRAFVRGRRQAVLAELDAPPSPSGGPRQSPCFKKIGSVSGSFATTWDSLSVVNPFDAGSGTLTATVDGRPMPIDLVGATAGLDTTGEDGPRAGVNVIVRLADGAYAAVVLRVLPADYGPNRTLPFDLLSTVGLMARFEGATSTAIGLLGGGAIDFDAGGAIPGAAVSGTFSADLIAWPF